MPHVRIGPGNASVQTGGHDGPMQPTLRRFALHLPMPTGPDLLGYAAATLVFLAFSARSILALRAMAIVSNLMFIAYGWFADLGPVLLLHLALLPMNAWRLWQGALAQSALTATRRAAPPTLVAGDLS